MAPSPEHDNEPKAPDKNDPKTVRDTPELRPSTTDLCEDPAANNLDLQESSVSTLDDGQLKALLDEAINYKTPKDREGKSKIFKVLLQEAEEDERNARAASASGPQLARYYNTAATRRHRNSTSRRENPSSTVSSRLTHGGSLQDLAQPDLYSDVLPSGHAGGRRSANSRRRTGGGSHHLGHHGGAGGVSVSARQREGGSLPSNVNAGAQYDRQLFEEDTVTVRGSKPRREKPLKSATTSIVNATVPQVPTVVKDKKMVEAETTSGAAATNTSPSPIRPDYTILDINAEPEETLSLLENEVVHSYESTQLADDALGKFTYQEDTYSTPMQVETVEDDIGDVQYSYPQQHALEEAIQQHRIPRVRYTSRATLEVDGVSGVVTSSGVAPIASQTVDKGILFPQLQQSLPDREPGGFQLEADYNSVRCFVESGAAAGVPTNASQMGAQGAQAGSLAGSIVPTQYRLLSVSNPKIIHGVDRFHSDKKGLDENGNSVNTTSTSHLDSKKKKKCKVDRNVTVLSSEQVEGHRADIIEDLDLLVQYIEQNDTDAPVKSSGKHHHNVNKMTNSKHNHQVENKRRTRVKSKSESVVKKSNSLEEISKTKLEDLMSEDVKSVRSRVKKQSTSEDGDRRSWGTEDGQQYMCGKRQALTDPQDFALTAETDFHVVTKKKKSKKQRRSSSGGRNFDDGAKMNHNSTHGHAQLKPAEHHRPHHRRVFAPDVEVPTRRKSACSVPPSDKSADSSDVDSVHSLPAGVHHRGAEPTPQVGTSPPGALTSYADIARTTGAPSNNSSASSNCSSQGSGNNNNNNNNNIQQTPTGKPQQSQYQPPVQPTVTPLTPSPVVAAVAPKNQLLLRSEHFPELCDPVALGEVLHRAEEFPSLELQPQPPAPVQRISPRVLGPQPPKVRNYEGKSSTLNSAVNINLKRQSVIRNRTGRPAVIILNDDQTNNGLLGAVSSASDAIQVSGLTFGFELNEQLLNNSDFSDDQCSDATAGDALDNRGAGERFIARFLAPISATTLADTYNHEKIVTFVGLAWEDVVHQTNNGKVQYYNGQ